MGSDTPLAVLSQTSSAAVSTISSSMFAQVTNPPIDAIRERDRHHPPRSIVGTQGNLLGRDSRKLPVC